MYATFCKPHIIICEWNSFENLFAQKKLLLVSPFGMCYIPSKILSEHSKSCWIFTGCQSSRGNFSEWVTNWVAIFHERDCHTDWIQQVWTSENK